MAPSDPECVGAALDMGDHTTRALHAIRHVMQQEIAALTLCCLVAGATVCVVLFVAWSISSALSDWSRVTQATVWGGRQRAAAGSNTAAIEASDDTAPRLGSRDADGLPTGMPMQRESSAVAARMSRVSGLYSAYNRAMQRDAARRGEVADDIMDRRIISRAEDNYTYKSRRRDRLRFRSDDDAPEVVKRPGQPGNYSL